MTGSDALAGNDKLTGSDALTGSDKLGDKPNRPTTIPNEVRVRRWVAFFFAALVATFAANYPVSALKAIWQMDGVWTWLPDTVTTFAGFVLAFLLSWVLLRLICKTSLRDLILGYGGKLDWAQCGKVAGFVLVGLVLSTVIFTDLGSVSLNEIGPLPILVCLLICLAFTWIQTTWEEIMFRCTFLRATCGNKIRASARCIVWGLVSSFVFMLGHMSNNEVTSQADVVDLVAGISCYFIAGLVLYFSDVALKNCMPGCIVHWVNNFWGFAILAQTGASFETGAIFVYSAPQNGVTNLLSVLVCYLPLAIFLIVEAVKNKRKAVEAAPAA